MICCQLFFNGEKGAGESFLFGDSERKKKKRSRGGGGGEGEEGWRMRKVVESIL